MEATSTVTRLQQDTVANRNDLQCKRSFTYSYFKAFFYGGRVSLPKNYTDFWKHVCFPTCSPLRWRRSPMGTSAVPARRRRWRIRRPLRPLGIARTAGSGGGRTGGGTQRGGKKTRTPIPRCGKRNEKRHKRENLSLYTFKCSFLSKQ